MSPWSLSFWGVCLTSLGLVLPPRGNGAELVTGDPIPLAGGTMHVSSYPPGHQSPPDVLIHLHGAVSATTDNFVCAEIDAVLVTINFKGLSSVYSRPFRESPALFNDVLDMAMDELHSRGHIAERSHWNRVCVSTFSAGFGAVREILKTREHLDRIDGILAADSIYAGLEKGVAERRVNERNMRDFRRFAGLASQEQKTFIVTHSYIETSYASTEETANDLLEFVGVQRGSVPPIAGTTLVLRNGAVRGNFTVLGYEGDTGEAHLKHLREIATWWRLLPLGGRRP